ncbi:class I SAM-dependent methyltransferase [Metabacillus herbersteinensis]|uniref:Class I SAM-dependent methyltransferase n=1 Tax=Metabacillus herbersteinensis TaxID=283816 RepID=A0ABV6GDQ2_9BACI
MDDHQIKKDVQRQFSQNAEKYVASESHAKGDDLSLMVDWLDPNPDWMAIDIATGGGHVTKALSSHVSTIFATDLTNQMLATAKKHLDSTCNNVWYVQADAESLPFLDSTFDLAVCRIAAHHFPNPELFVQEVHRVLKPGGKFLLIDNVAPDDKGLDQFVNTLEKLRDPSHGRSYTINEWKKLFRSSSFIEVRSSNRKKTYSFPVWVSRTATTEEQVQEVQNHLCLANDTVKNYFAITIEDGQILSLHVDELMILLEK